MTRFSLTKKITASDYEYSYAKPEGVEFAYNKKPVEITDDGVIFRDLIEQADGSQEEIAGSDQLYPYDRVIISISQGPMNVIVNTIAGLEANRRGLLVADDVGRISRPGIFASAMWCRVPERLWRQSLTPSVLRRRWISIFRVCRKNKRASIQMRIKQINPVYGFHRPDLNNMFRFWQSSMCKWSFLRRRIVYYAEADGIWKCTLPLDKLKIV